MKSRGSTCRSRAVWRIGLLAGMLALVARPAVPQDATEPALKGALVFNFAKFTSWPEDALPRNADLAACVIGSNAVGQALERAVKNRPLDGHVIKVTNHDLRDPHPSFRACHLLYLTGTDQKQYARLLADLRGLPVLTIVDVDDPSSPTAIVDLFVENGRMRFQVDNGLARQGRLAISSRLLSVASGVRDNARRDALGGVR